MKSSKSQDNDFILKIDLSINQKDSKSDPISNLIGLLLYAGYEPSALL